MNFIGNRETVIGGRHVPVSGTEANRAARALQILANEIHTTSDQRRLFIENILLGGAVWHGEVADEAEMLALDATAERGCWAMDWCERADTETLWLCVNGRGETLTDWREFPLCRLPDSPSEGDLAYFNGTSWVSLPLGTAGQVLKVNAGATAPEWADA